MRTSAGPTSRTFASLAEPSRKTGLSTGTMRGGAAQYMEQSSVYSPARGSEAPAPPTCSTTKKNRVSPLLAKRNVPVVVQPVLAHAPLGLKRNGSRPHHPPPKSRVVQQPRSHSQHAHPLYSTCDELHVPLRSSLVLLLLPGWTSLHLRNASISDISPPQAP